MSDWKQIKVRVPADYAEQIQDYAKHKKVFVSELCRLSLYDYMHNGNQIGPQLNAIRRELSAIGNNINQIARHLNSGKDAELTEEIKESLQDMRHDLKRVLKKTWH
ncbi:MobC family plasmid mobilization relaxosome protein [Gluconobacter cerinus]|uniref:MobC family plasmid mobilization relaxosome protein n=1 Tax=Gluconobacter cerinus TaxID=38307 RepID=UPI0020111260|nr:MobC family plasmid mobilization relaxosome protein [Gluconobacter cerinus]